MLYCWEKNPLQQNLTINLDEFFEDIKEVNLQNFEKKPKRDTMKNFLAKRVSKIKAMEAIVSAEQDQQIKLEAFATNDYTEEIIKELPEHTAEVVVASQIVQVQEQS